MADDLYLAFWNLENLFDVESADRPEKVRKAIAKDIEGWDDALLDAKLSQLSRVIRSLNQGRGPDILGVCEVENQEVLLKLTRRVAGDGGRSYAVAHADTSDNRGIDVAFLYDPNRASVPADGMFQHWVVKRFPTRELFQVNFALEGSILVLICNHWPSRTSGQYESEPFRITAGETLAYWVQRIHEEQGERVGVVALGDFNDEPFNRSLMEYALSVSDQRQVMEGKNHYLLNLMWPFLASGRGSHYYDGRWNALDQIMVSRGVVSGGCGWGLGGAAEVEAVGIMSRPRGQGPRRFGISPKQRDAKGFSDHYPVGVALRRMG